MNKAKLGFKASLAGLSKKELKDKEDQLLHELVTIEFQFRNAVMPYKSAYTAVVYPNPLSYKLADRATCSAALATYEAAVNPLWDKRVAKEKRIDKKLAVIKKELLK